MNNLTQRAITGFFFVVIVVGAMLAGPYTFMALCALVTFGALLEFYKLLIPDERFSLRLYGAITGAVLFLLCMHFWDERSYNILNGVVFALVFGTFIMELFSGAEKPFERIAYIVTGWLYVAIPFVLLFNLSVLDSAAYDYILPLSVLIFIWTNDTFAYLIGRMIGKTPLFKRISPNKTIEGTLGGLICVGIAAYIFSTQSDYFNPMQWIGLGLTAAVFGSLGDLVESMLKRSLNIKDSGNILPGHGGLLDRFDATLLASPFVYAYVLIIS